MWQSPVILGSIGVKMITIKHIAKHFGISTAAVSKALNGLEGVSEELRSEIMEFAKKNNYIPNLYGRGLKGNKINVLGVVISDNTNPMYSKLIKGIEAEANDHAFNIILCNSSENRENELKQIQMLLQKKIDGLLIVPAQLEKEEAGDRYDILDRLNIPYVCIDRSLPGSSCDIVKSDNVYGTKLGTRYLIDHGHTRIIYASSAKKISSAREREQGYLEAMREAGLPADENNIVYLPDTSREDNRNEMLRVLEKRDDFSAVFAFNDTMAFAILQALYIKGKRIPGDVALMGYDNNDFAEICMVPLTTVSQDSYHFGKLAVKAIMERINNERTQFVQCVVKTRGIIERDSV